MTIAVARTPSSVTVRARCDMCGSLDARSAHRRRRRRPARGQQLVDQHRDRRGDLPEMLL